MIDRYTRAEMAGLWTDEAVIERWVRIERAVASAQAALGIIPVEAAAAIERAPLPEIGAIRAAEQHRDHEVLSFLAVWTAGMEPAAARWVHYGLTSYDLVDTGLGCALSQSADLVIEAATELAATLSRRALEFWDTRCVARTHGVHAEPTTFGHKLGAFAFAVDRATRRLAGAREMIAVGTISGPVGTYSTVDPRVEQLVCERLGLRPEEMPTQVVARDRHADLVGVLAVLGSCVEQMALEFRLLQRTEVAEIEEPRTAAYQGSSAMPHKRNPTTSERLCGLARLLRANAGAVLEDVALWHERDLAHSSVERVVFPDAFNVVYYQCTAMTQVVDQMVVHGDRMLHNLAATNGRIYSSAAYNALLERGYEREEAYRLVQRAAELAAGSGRELAETLAAVTGLDDLRRVDAADYLANHGVLHDRLRALDRRLRGAVAAPT